VEYRKFGKLNWKASALGFGAMRLPNVDEDRNKINEPLAIDMIRYAIDHGVNYIDTAYGYHRGNSERLVGKALMEGYRDKVKLATKMPTWLISSQKDMDKYLKEQLEKLQTDHIDFYLLHGLRKTRWPTLVKNNVFEWAKKVQDDGKIHHLGFSFHDDYNLFKEIVDYYDNWTFCQIQYNYMDTEYQAGIKGLKYAASKDLAVVVMEPIQGGRLAVPPPEGIQSIWNEARAKRTPAEWALKWVWNHPEVSVVLSGMSTMQHVVENLESANNSSLDNLSVNELNLIERVKEKYRELGFIGCTSCRYCVPCPENVAIPEIFTIFNTYYANDSDESNKALYSNEIAFENRASKCVQCGECEQLCPQQLPIINLLRSAVWTFESN
jgi:predicted aldo/keto reductase-like oxidoreductase